MELSASESLWIITKLTPKKQQALLFYERQKTEMQEGQQSTHVTSQPVGKVGMGPKCFDYEARETGEVKVLLPGSNAHGSQVALPSAC